MHIYVDQAVTDGELVVGDLLRSTRGIHSLVIVASENIAVLTEAGKCYNMSYAQAANGVRLASVDLSALRFDCVFSDCFVADLVTNYKAEVERKALVAQLADIPADVLEAALEARRNQNLIHSRPIKS